MEGLNLCRRMQFIYDMQAKIGKLTMAIIVGGRANTMITITIHTFLSDRAYARRAEKAGNK